jgi:hypothetical protein
MLYNKFASFVPICGISLGFFRGSKFESFVEVG